VRREAGGRPLPVPAQQRPIENLRHTHAGVKPV
jgi:hypothetical protein